MTTNASLMNGGPALPITSVVSDSTMAYSGVGAALAGVNQLLPYHGISGLGPFGADWFSGKKPLLTFTIGTLGVEGGCFQVLFDLAGSGAPTLWRQWFIGGGSGAALVFTTEQGVILPSWQIQLSYVNLAAAFRDVNLFVSLRAF